MAVLCLPLTFTLTLALLAARAASHSLPPGGCNDCDHLKIGYYLDDYIGPPGIPPNAPGSGSINVMRFTTEFTPGKLIGKGPVSADNIAQCCKLCAKTTGCSYFHFYPKPSDLPKRKLLHAAPCYLISGNFPQYTRNKNLSIPISILGGKCNPAPGATDDPHFTGAHGTAFDFNGDLDKSFCFLSDAKVHINVFMGGYLDENMNGGGTFLTNGKKMRTWMREVAVMWKDGAGDTHSVHLVACKGEEALRTADSFLGSITVDGEEQAKPLAVGDTVVAPGGFKFQLVEVALKAISEVDTYSLEIEGVLEMRLELRPAHPALRKNGDSWVHFNLHIDDVKVTPQVHGLLGQTYREDAERRERTLRFKSLNEVLDGPVIADGESGKGFLDGQVSDYETTGMTQADCKFSQAWQA